MVVDKAVEERIRTDGEFGEGHYGFWDWNWWYPPVSVGGITLKDLEEFDMTKPIPDGMDLVADMLIQSGSSYGAGLPELEGNQYGYRTRQLFLDRMRNELAPFRKVVLDEDAVGWKFPTNDKDLAAVLRSGKLDPENIVDPWGTPYGYGFDIALKHRPGQ